MRPTRPGATTRSVTLILSVVIALVLVGVFVFLGVSSPSRTDAGGEEAPELEVVEDLLAGAESGRRMTFQIVDETNPDRVAAEVFVERIDPDGPSFRLVEAPTAWVFADDGSTWLIEAERGRFYIPEGQEQPREGYIAGNVRARRYDALPGGERPDPERDEASITATTDQPLHFDLDMLRFETEGRLRVESEEIDFAGRNVLVVLNEQKESISLLRVQRGERLTYTPAREGTGSARGPGEPRVRHAVRAAAFTPGAPPPPADAPADAAPEPKVDLYEVRFEERVEVTTGSRVIESDLLTVWARLIENKIPDRAGGATAAGPLGGLAAAMATAVPGAAPERTPGAGGGEISAPAGSGDPAERGVGSGDPVVLTWAGALELRPLEDEPDELAMGDDVALRFEATDGHVEFEDSADGAHGRALTVDYYSGRERVELVGSKGSVELASPGAGRIDGVNAMTIELGAGSVSVPTPGGLTGAADDATPGAEAPQRVTWQDSARFDFEVRDGRMTDRIRRASFEGGVEGLSRDARLTGSRVVAVFDSDEGGGARLVQVEADRARGEDGRGGSVSGDRLEAHFARGTHGEEIDPTRVILTGSALARGAGGESIRAERIDATLARDESGDVVVTETACEGGVVFEDGAGVTGRGERVRADVLAERAVITGEGGRVGRNGTVVSGSHIELDGAARTVRVEGAGTFEHREPDADGGAGRRIVATWTDRMSFDDLAGHVACAGATRAESVLADGSRDRVEAARLVLTLDPSSEGAEGADQRLRRARAFGSSAEDPAVVESRRVEVGTPPRGDVRVNELFRLEGGEIDLLAREKRLVVPGPGRLFVLDRRPGGGERGIVGPGGRRGTSLFSWSESFAFDRGEGEAVFAGEARAAHKPLDRSAMTEVEGDSIVARFETAEGSVPGAATALEGDLLWAMAVGGAMLRIEREREIVADRLLYHAADGVVEASSELGGRVSVFDFGRGVPSSFDALRWNLRTDRVEAINPGAVVVPE